MTLFRQQTLQKYYSDELRNFYAIHEAQNADNRKNVQDMIWKNYEFHATNGFVVRRWQQCLFLIPTAVPKRDK